ncbi:MAG TPA: DUF2927 domain-containing protein [Dongiaceae bacterium]
MSLALTRLWLLVGLVFLAHTNPANAQQENHLQKRIESLAMFRSADGVLHLRKWTVPIELDWQDVNVPPQHASGMGSQDRSNILQTIEQLLRGTLGEKYLGMSQTGNLHVEFFSGPSDEFKALWRNAEAHQNRYNETCSDVIYNEDSTLTYPIDAEVDPLATHITDGSIVVNAASWQDQPDHSWKCLNLAVFGVLGIHGEVEASGGSSLFSQASPAKTPTASDLDLLKVVYSDQLRAGASVAEVRRVLGEPLP